MSELSKTIESIRKDFPLISGSNIAYLDNAATTQKPQAVLDAVLSGDECQSVQRCIRIK